MNSFATFLLAAAALIAPSHAYSSIDDALSFALEAAAPNVKEGFTVLPYCMDDPILAQKLHDESPP